LKENCKRKGDAKSSTELEHTGSVMKELKVDVICVCKQLDSRKKNSNISS